MSMAFIRMPGSAGRGMIECGNERRRRREVTKGTEAAIINPEGENMTALHISFSSRAAMTGARHSGFCPGTPLLLTLLMVFGMGALSGCSLAGFSRDLTGSILNQPDPGIVRDGAPAYLLLVDSLIARNPGNADHLLTGAKLYGAYAAAFVEDKNRARLLAARALEYSGRALCIVRPAACGLAEKEFADFVEMVREIDRRHVPEFFAFLESWLVWINVQEGDWSALAELPKIQAGFNHILLADETYNNGGAHLYLGILNSLRPPSMGGKPEKSRHHFERAIEISGGRDLMVKVEFARYYARLVYDRQLHDRLLREVLEFDGEAPGLVLKNALAKGHARELLNSADDYF